MGTAREQFEKEAAALAQLVRDMINAGQVLEAEQLLDQYALLNPADPQILELRGIMNERNQKGKQQSPPPEPVSLQDPARLLESIESFFIVEGILAKKWGFLNSILGKMKLLEDKYGYRSILLTTTHDIDLRKKEAWLRSLPDNEAIISPGTEIANIYEYFQKSYTEGLDNKAVYSRGPEYDGCHYEKVSDNSFAVTNDNIRMFYQIICRLLS